MKKIFISYSHKDEKWKERLSTQLQVLGLNDYCEVWDDSRIPPGKDWKKEIESALNRADVAILMISDDFLASDFIIKYEVPSILGLQKMETLEVIPVIVGPCQWETVNWLVSMQVFPQGGAPLSESSEPEIIKKLSTLAGRIEDIIKDKPDESKTIEKKTVLLTDLPQREIDLIGRDEELQMLGERLKKTERLLLVNGLGGIGKTEVCKRFFLCNYKRFSFAAWIDYVSSIKESMVNRIGIKRKGLELNESDTLDERFQKIMDFLKNLEEDTLLVFDNIEDPGDEHLGTLKKLPANIKVIANSRLHLEGFEVHPLDFLSARSCKDLFYNYYEGERDDSHAAKLIELCGSHTLTVELLARTARNAAMPVKTLYETLKNKGFNLNDIIGDKVHTFWHNEKERKRFFNHLLMVFDLSGVTDAGLHILVNLSVLPAVYIPVNDFSEWMGLKSKEEINALERKGWLRKSWSKKSGFTIFMHQVIQEVVRGKVIVGVEKCKDLIISLGNKLHCEPGENPLNKKEFVQFGESLLGHIVEDNNDLATLANNLSLIYKSLGQLEKALEFQLKDVKISEKILAKDHPDLATSYNNLSLIYKAKGKLEKALEFQLKANDIYEQVFDKNHPDLATSYNNLSLIYDDLKDYKKAVQYAEKAIAILQHLFPNGHPNLDTMKNNLELIKKEMK